MYRKRLKPAILHEFYTLYKSRENEREKQMGLASFQLNIFALNARKVAINREMMAIQDEREIYSTQYDKIVNSNTEWYKDPNVKYLQSREDGLDNELGELETQLKDIEKNIESLEKGRDENLKKGIPSLAS